MLLATWIDPGEFVNAQRKISVIPALRAKGRGILSPKWPSWAWYWDLLTTDKRELKVLEANGDLADHLTSGFCCSDKTKHSLGRRGFISSPTSTSQAVAEEVGAGMHLVVKILVIK